MEKVKILYIDDQSSRYMKKGLNELELSDYKGKKYITICDYVSYDGEKESSLPDLIKKVEGENYLAIFIDSILYIQGMEVKTNGIWIAYILATKFPLSNIYIVSSKNDEETSFANRRFKFFDKISKDFCEDDKIKYVNELNSCIDEKIKRDDAFNLFEELDTEVPASFEDQMLLLLDKVAHNNYENFPKSSDFKEIICMLERVYGKNK